MLPFEERLEQFGRKTEASIDELIVLTQSAPVAESAVAAQAVLARYGRLVAQLGEIAAQHQLSGAHAVCALVETNLLLLQDDKRALTPGETATLEAWPMLLLGYIANHADRDASTALLQSLAGHWPISLPLESAAEELRLLMGQAEPASSAPAAEEPASAILGPAMDDAGETALLPVTREAYATREAAPANVAAEDAPIVSAGCAGLAAEEPVAPDNADLELPPFANAVLEQPEAGITSTVPVYLNAFAPAEPAQTPGAEAAAADSVPEASTSQPAVPAEFLPESVEHNDGGASFAAALLPPATGTQHVTRPMLDILLDELKPLNEAFESVIAEATQGSDDDRLAALGELLDFMERLKLAVETIGLTVLAALLTRIKVELVLLPGGLSEDHRELLRRLPRAMVAYLQAPDAPAAAAGLVVLLADTRWSNPLAGYTLAAWRAALADIALSESTSAPAPAPVAPEEVHAVEALTGDALPGETASRDMPATAFGLDASAGAELAAAPELTRDETPPAEPEADVSAPGTAELEAVPSVAAGETSLAGAAPLVLAEPVHAKAPAAGLLSADVALENVAPETAAAQDATPEPSTWQDTAMSAGPDLAAHAESAAEVPPLSPPGAGGQSVERPMVQILLDELQPLNDEFTALVSAATRGVADDRLAALGDLLDLLERVKITVEGIGLTALAALLAQIGLAIVSLPDGLTDEHRDLLHGLPDALTAYLRAPDDAAACAGLVALLADSRWPVAATEETRAAWRAALSDMEVSETSAHLTPARATAAAPEDVSLELPAEVNSELLDGLLQELPVQVSAFTSAVASITGPRGTLKDAEQAMRAAHTLKGAANTVGIPGIANLTHQLEDILVALGEAGRLPQGKLADVLTDAGDCLEAMSEFLLGLGAAPDNAQAILQQVLDLANRIDREGIAELLGDAAALPAAEATPQAAPSQTAAASKHESTEAAAVDQKQQPQAATEQSLRVPAPLVDELLSLAGETLISNSQLQDHLKSTIIQNQAVHRQHQLILKLVGELETLVDIRGITSQQQGAEQGDGFDSLEFEHYNELQTISRQLMEATTDAREMSHMAEQELDALEEALGDQQRLQMANQHALLRTRMMPVSNIIPRLQRSVRQTGRLLDKQVEFTVTGEGTRMDTNVLNDLMDPLMHMLRNAVDHGIEKPEVRLAEGKSPEGHIELAFAREGDTIVVRCRDDGAGLDHAAIRRIAESKGMIVLGHIHTNEELARLILMPGFSTRDEASQVSGRGVGMDVVYSRVQQMKGMLSLDSQKGRGLVIELRLPATLLSMHALIIRQRERRFAVSTRGVEDIRYVSRENVVEIGARQFVRDGEKIYALLRLEQALAMPPDRRAKDRAGHPVLLLRMEDGSERAVLVQEVLESREIVMKKFNRFVPQVSGVIGAAILGNGEVAPVIDLFDLFQAPVRKLASAQRAQGASAAVAAPEEKPRRALVVDDSLSARRAVVQLLKDEGYEIRTANDGLEAVSVLERWIPDIIISDMEMPRMNGLELTSNVRHAEQTRDVPVIMITSRSTAKHRQMSAAAGVSLHMIKPFSDDELVTQVSRLTEKAQ
ncbi:MAG TPA: response regulator [Gallionellaceae bacterium]|nr:response regulator [Gallionellaceae bacterium]